MLTILKEQPVSVSARGTHHIDSNVCDVAYLEILFANGIIGNVHVSWLHPLKIRQTTIVGSKKMAVYNDVSETEKVHIYDKGLSMGNDGSGNGHGGNGNSHGGNGNSHGGNGNGKFSAWPPNYRYGDVIIPFISSDEPLKVESNHFISCIKEGKKPKSDGWSGLKVVSILEAADRSLANGGHREKVEIAAPAVV
jgi:predicted dehydrogenase